jgi:predicted transcriptional regulator
MKRLNLYYFGDIGVYDKYNPAYVCDENLVSEILYIIAENEPFSLTQEDISKFIDIDNHRLNNIINNLKRINAIEENKESKEKFKINFPIFLERDIEFMDRHLKNVGELILNKIKKVKPLIIEKLKGMGSYNKFDEGRLLYHIICDMIFDGTAFDFFEERNVFTSSKLQPGNRNYMIIGYEDSSLVDNYSNKLLCSSNNYGSNKFIFNSFGDSNGLRKDMYRFFRMTQQSIKGSTPFQDTNLAYIKIVDKVNKNIAEKCGQIMWGIFSEATNYNELSNEDKELAIFLKDMDYINIDETDNKLYCNVPIFQEKDMKIVNEIGEIILTEILETVKNTLSSLEKDSKNLTAIKHKVNIKEVGNELWHQIFGRANEELIKEGIVAKPYESKEEGRYLKSMRVYD